MKEIAMSLFFIIGLPLLAIGLHEITHLLTARSISPVSIELSSYVPLRLRLNFAQTPPSIKLRVVALAPTLVGCISALIAFQSGIWQQLQDTGPYYLRYLIGINWLLYVLPSPADLRVALQPLPEGLASKEAS